MIPGKTGYFRVTPGMDEENERFFLKRWKKHIRVAGDEGLTL